MKKYSKCRTSAKANAVEAKEADSLKLRDAMLTPPSAALRATMGRCAPLLEVFSGAVYLQTSVDVYR